MLRRTRSPPIFSKLHQYIWKTEKKTPSAAFEELIKVVFIKIKKDKEIFEKHGKNPKLKKKDVVFSTNWIKNQTEERSPINSPLFRNLIQDLEAEIRKKRKKRIFDVHEEIRLHPSTIEKIVEDIQHINFHKMDEDIHGRMFESFLDATVRGQELGQYFTPRDIVKLMVKLANISVTKNGCDSILDACCGSGGFLISAMNDMFEKAESISGLSNKEIAAIREKITNDSLHGIDGGSVPPIYRIARMNMYLHGDGGSNIFFADSLDKSFHHTGKLDPEIEDELEFLRNTLPTKKFDVILSNPPFSLSYSKDHVEQKRILHQYDIYTFNKKSNSLPSSVMFIERYRDLVSDGGRVLAIVDDSILSGESFRYVRDYIREHFIIKAVISLPGDAFRRAEARVKTSIIILRKKSPGETQPALFMDKAIYLGLTNKTARRIGILPSELEPGKKSEFDRIVKNYLKFESGKKVENIVPPERIVDRLDVKYCLSDKGRLIPIWQEMGLKVSVLSAVLKKIDDREVTLKEEREYTLLKVTYSGEILEAETKFGEELSYARLQKVRSWDILFSNMGVGRGAIAIVPDYHDGLFVSPEYTPHS